MERCRAGGLPGLPREPALAVTDIITAEARHAEYGDTRSAPVDSASS